MEDAQLGMRQKKGATVKDTFLVIVVAIFVFGAIFAFVVDNADEADVPVPDRYNETYNQLQQKQGELNTTAITIRDFLGSVDEAKQGDYGFFGLKGVLAIMLAPLKVIDVGLEALNLGIGIIDYTPSAAIAAATLGITVVIVFALVAFITQRGKEP